MAKLAANCWILTKKQIEDITVKDAIWRSEEVPIPIGRRDLLNLELGEWYVKYCLLFQDLSKCLDQYVQPQKRISIKKLIDGVTMRLLEFNETLRQLDMSEFHYVDGNIAELKLLPQDIEILHPALFSHRPVNVEEMWRKIKKGEKIFLPPKEEEEHKDEDAEKKRKRPPPKRRISAADKRTSAEEQAEMARKAKFNAHVVLIQTAERCRQERMFFLIKVTILNAKKKAKAIAIERALKGYVEPKDAPTPEQIRAMENSAATLIQRIWRGHSARKTLRVQEMKRRIIAGMYMPSWRSKEPLETLDIGIEKRRDYRYKRLKEYVEAIDNEKARILRVLTPRFMEDISDEIREWFEDWYKNCNKFDTFPPEILGGTVLVVTGQTLTPQEYIKKQEEEKAMGKKAVEQMKQDLKDEKLMLERRQKELERRAVVKYKKMMMKRAIDAKKTTPNQFRYYHDPPVGQEFLDAALEEYKVHWNDVDDFKNPLETHYMDMVTEQLAYEAQLECRRIVDNMMRLELNILQKALSKDTKKKFKKVVDKKKKNKKGKKVKDPTGKRLVEDLFQELVDNGIIRTYPKVSLADFHGDFSYTNWETRNKDYDPPPAIVDVRQAVVMNCILPLGIEVFKRPKSVLISGIPHSGKHILANAIFNATQCVLFDLSPEVTAGKYMGKDIKMLVHLVTKMSKLLAPSIIFFDGAEKIFYKRVPKEERKFQPKRMGKNLKPIIKSIKPEDRVMILGITSQPFAGSGQLKKLYERHILVPLPDYNSVYIFWHEILMSYHGINRDFNITALSRVTVHYPFAVLRTVMEEILTVKRLVALEYDPITPMEIYNYMVINNIEPVDPKDWSKYEKWYGKTDLAKRRKKYIKFVEELRAKEE